MNESRKTKKALRGSLLALFLCVVLLIGTTFAWFTDSVSTGVNSIKSGNLKIDAEYTLDGETWNKLDKAEGLFGEGLFEPGYTRVVAFRISNKGNLALKYNMNMNVISEEKGINKDGKEFALSDYLKVKTTPVQQVNDIGNVMLGLSFDRNASKAIRWSEADFNDSEIMTQDQVLSPGSQVYSIMQVYMPETVGNEANAISSEKAPQIDFSINVVATQATVESDSFGTDYDKNAEYPTIKTADSLEEVFGGADVDFGYGSTSTGPVILDGQGTAIVKKWTDAWVNSDTTIKGVTFKNGAVFSTKTDNVTVTLENCTFYACDQSKLTYTGNNSLTNSGAGMCLNLEKSSNSGIRFVVKNCTFIGENDSTLPVDGPRYNGDGTTNGMKKRGHAIALDAICGGGTGTLDSLLIEGCNISGVRGNAIQLYGTTGDITIKDTKINSWAVNNTGVGYAVRGDFNTGGSRTLTLKNVYFGLNEISGNTEFGHVKVGSFPGNTNGSEAAGTYSK